MTDDAASNDNATPRSAGAGLPRVTSAALFQGRRELIIEHDGDVYRLQITSRNKLILIK